MCVPVYSSKIQKLVLTVLGIFSFTLLNAKTFYVSPDGVGNGSILGYAYGYLHTAIEIANEVDEIGVKKGTNIFTNHQSAVTRSNSTISFGLNENIKFLGGFNRDETELDQ